MPSIKPKRKHIIDLIALGLYGGDKQWSPLELFQSGELGAWYDPSDLTTLYQDAAGTVPVTSDGDPVGKMEDKSGNGNHATQSVSASRPVYRTDGALHWLEAGGVDDYLKITNNLIDVTLDQVMSAALSTYDGKTSPYFIGTEPLDKGFELLLHHNSERLRPAVVTTSGIVASNDTVSLTINQNYVINERWDRSSGNLVLDKNGVEVVNASGTPADIQTPAIGYELFSGNGGNSARCWSGTMLGFVICSKTATDNEITELNNYMASKSGVAL